MQRSNSWSGMAGGDRGGTGPTPGVEPRLAASEALLAGVSVRSGPVPNMPNNPKRPLARSLMEGFNNPYTPWPGFAQHFIADSFNQRSAAVLQPQRQRQGGNWGSARDVRVFRHAAAGASRAPVAPPPGASDQPGFQPLDFLLEQAGDFVLGEIHFGEFDLHFLRHFGRRPLFERTGE